MNKVFLVLVLTLPATICWALPVISDGVYSQRDLHFGEEATEFCAERPADDRKFRSDRIIISQRTGRIMAGSSVPVYKSAMVYQGIHIRIAPEPGGGVNQGSNERVNWDDAVTVGQIVMALLDLAVHPADIIDILRLFQQEGVLQAELEIR